MKRVGWLRRWRRRSDDPLGARGERAAERWLKQHRYRIIDRNLRIGRDEVDIVAIDPDGKTVVIVEVKTRRDDDVRPEHQVNHTKQHHLTRFAAKLHQRREYRDRPFRFDVIAVIWRDDEPPEIRHHMAAFEATF